MSYIADFDPTGFDPADPLTWPVPAPYSPGSWWYITAPGAIDGVPVDVGDRVYPVGTGRLYGELDYGDSIYGGDVTAPPWPADPLRVRWRPTSNSAPAWDQPPPPYAGCPLFGGWRIVLDARFVINPLTRLYGSDTYGSGAYGDELGLSSEWVDITPGSFGIVARRGGSDGSPVVDVDQMQAELLDFDASLFPMTPVTTGPNVGTPIRVSVLDSTGNPYPLFSGRIGTLSDPHGDSIRSIALDAYGFVSDLATALVSFTGGTDDPPSQRIDYLLGAAGWTWGVKPYPTTAALLRRVEQVELANARGELDRAALSASWYVTTDSSGRLDVKEWPLVPVGNAIVVTDQKGATGLASSELTYVSDSAELLNVAIGETEEVQGAAAIVVERRDPPSIGRFGRSSGALGFPAGSLSAKQADLESLVDGAVARYGRIVTRCDSVEADSGLDPRWVDVLANLEIGQPLRTVRSKPTPLVLDHVVVGVEHRLTRGRWSATIYLSTVTETI